MSKGMTVYPRRFVIALAMALLFGLLIGTALAATPPPAPSAQAPAAGDLSEEITRTVYLPLVSYDSGRPETDFGVQYYGSYVSLGEPLELAETAGAEWARWLAPWSSVEPTNTIPAEYHWSFMDSAVISATQRGKTNLILTLSHQPEWAAEYPMGPVYDTADLKEYLTALVERYDGDGYQDAEGSPVVRYFEIYNEPDNIFVPYAEHGGWSIWGFRGAEYAELLQELYPVIKAASPKAEVVLGGLALDWFYDEETGTGRFDPDFLDDVLAACQGKQCFDVMNFHYFPFYRAVWEPYGPSIIGKTAYVRQRLAVYGFDEMPVICSEISWPAASGWGSDELQSRYVVKGFVRGMAAELEIVIWYFIQDGDDDSEPGLLTNALVPKTAYWAYDTMTEMLDPAYFERALTSAETGSEQLVGYSFSRLRKRLDVVWTEDDTWFDDTDDPSLSLTVQAETLRVVDKLGNEVWLYDATDGDDGRITLTVGGSPLFLEYD